MYNFIYFWTVCIGNGRFDVNIERVAYEECRETRNLYTKSEFALGPRKMFRSIGSSRLKSLNGPSRVGSITILYCLI
jgi:hypothetical protein